MSKSKKKKRRTVHYNTNEPDNRSYFRKIVSHYSAHPGLFFAILFLAVMITLAITQQS